MKTMLLMLSLLLFTFSAVGSEALETSSMNDILNKVNQLNDAYGSKNVLVVFDIDNTILASSDELGSDQWFTWQEGLLFANSNDPKKITNDFNKLLDAQGLLFYKNRMRMPEESITRKTIKKIQKSGNTTFALTSRGPSFKYQTIRELLKNGIDLSVSSPTFISKFYKVEKAFNPEQVVQYYEFSPDQVQSFKLTKSRDVQYLDGVFYTAGMHKGVMLRIFIKEAKLSPKAIVFVDDKKKHTTRVQAAFEDKDINVVTFRYSKEDSNVDRFNKNEKNVYYEKWSEIKKN